MAAQATTQRHSPRGPGRTAALRALLVVLTAAAGAARAEPLSDDEVAAAGLWLEDGCPDTDGASLSLLQRRGAMQLVTQQDEGAAPAATAAATSAARGGAAGPTAPAGRAAPDQVGHAQAPAAEGGDVIGAPATDAIVGNATSVGVDASGADAPGTTGGTMECLTFLVLALPYFAVRGLLMGSRSRGTGVDDGRVWEWRSAIERPTRNVPALCTLLLAARARPFQGLGAGLLPDAVVGPVALGCAAVLLMHTAVQACRAPPSRADAGAAPECTAATLDAAAGVARFTLLSLLAVAIFAPTLPLQDIWARGQEASWESRAVIGLLLSLAYLLLVTLQCASANLVMSLSRDVAELLVTHRLAFLVEVVKWKLSTASLLPLLCLVLQAAAGQAPAVPPCGSVVLQLSAYAVLAQLCMEVLSPDLGGTELAEFRAAIDGNVGRTGTRAVLGCMLSKYHLSALSALRWTGLACFAVSAAVFFAFAASMSSRAPSVEFLCVAALAGTQAALLLPLWCAFFVREVGILSEDWFSPVFVALGEARCAASSGGPMLAAMLVQSMARRPPQPGAAVDRSTLCVQAWLCAATAAQTALVAIVAARFAAPRQAAALACPGCSAESAASHCAGLAACTASAHHAPMAARPAGPALLACSHGILGYELPLALKPVPRPAPWSCLGVRAEPVCHAVIGAAAAAVLTASTVTAALSV